MTLIRSLVIYFTGSKLRHDFNSFDPLATDIAVDFNKYTDNGKDYSENKAVKAHGESPRTEFSMMLSLFCHSLNRSGFLREIYARTVVVKVLSTDCMFCATVCCSTCPSLNSAEHCVVTVG